MAAFENNSKRTIFYFHCLITRIKDKEIKLPGGRYKVIAPGSLFPLLVAGLALNPPSVSFAKMESCGLFRIFCIQNLSSVFITLLSTFLSFTGSALVYYMLKVS